MYKNIVVLTGAGISAESGIPVFRSETGLWESERIEEVCTAEAMVRDSLKVHNFYNKLRRNLQAKEPNAAHLALTQLQAKWPQLYGGEVTLVTQNVDNLHEKAHSQHVIHMHGELMSLWCRHCDRHYPFSGDSSPSDKCKFCGHTEVRPDIVFFGEMPYFMDKIEEKLAACDLFIAIGTSGVVYPAAGFCQFARSVGARCVELNLTKSAVATNFTDAIYGKASETVPSLVTKLLESGNF
jgi:NAD-dependent deacetylase